MKTLALSVLFLCLSVPLHALQAEYHWTLCGTSPAAVKQKLGGKVKKSSRRFLYYLDTKQRDLFRAGVVLRMRGETGEPVEVTAKVTTQESRVPDEFKDEDGFKCEADFQGKVGTVHCSFSVENISQSDLEDVLKGRQSAETLFSQTQLKYLTALGARISWRSLEAVGAIDNLKWKLGSAPVPFDLELMTTRSGATLLQLSTKEDSASQSRFGELTKHLGSKGVAPCQKQIGTAAWALGQN